MNTTIAAAQDHTIYDVIISGGGPVGLLLACELALARCSVLVLEQTEDPHSPLKRLPFGLRGLNTPSIESLYRRGLLQELELHKRIKNPHAPAGAQGAKPKGGGHFAGLQFNDDKIDTTQWPYRLPGIAEPAIMTEMEELETVLAHRAVALGVTIKRGLGVTGFQQSADVVTVDCDAQSFESKWLVGCDGSRSTVRKAGGFEFAGTDPEFTGYSAQVDLDGPEQLRPGRNLTATGMYLQSQPGYLILQDFDGGAFHNSGAPITLAHLQAVLRHITGTDVTINALHTATSWADRSRQATAYRNGRVLLAGDAAHIHSPLGGQGLNLGLGDAMNLGWKLAATIHKQASEGLLDSYFAERHPVGAQVLDWSRAQVAIMKPDPHARALHAVVRDLMHTRDGATYFAGRVWGLLTRYDLDEGHPLTGRSVPDFEFEDGTKVAELMRDGRGLLLDFNDIASLKKLADEIGDSIKYVAGSAKEQLGLSAVLVRPDGIVAWASEGAPDLYVLLREARRWFSGV